MNRLNYEELTYLLYKYFQKKVNNEHFKKELFMQLLSKYEPLPANVQIYTFYFDCQYNPFFEIDSNLLNEILKNSTLKLISESDLYCFNFAGEFYEVLASEQDSYKKQFDLFEKNSEIIKKLPVVNEDEDYFLKFLSNPFKSKSNRIWKYSGSVGALVAILVIASLGCYFTKSCYIFNNYQNIILNQTSSFIGMITASESPVKTSSFIATTEMENTEELNESIDLTVGLMVIVTILVTTLVVWIFLVFYLKAKNIEFLSIFKRKSQSSKK